MCIRDRAAPIARHILATYFAQQDGQPLPQLVVPAPAVPAPVVPAARVRVAANTAALDP